MKCPKCGYLGFETTDRCRNCGYDFSLAPFASEPELTLRNGDKNIEEAGDFDLPGLSRQSDTQNTGGLDLDRLFGEAQSPSLASFGHTPPPHMLTAPPEAPPAPRKVVMPNSQVVDLHLPPREERDFFDTPREEPSDEVTAMALEATAPVDDEIIEMAAHMELVETAEPVESVEPVEPVEPVNLPFEDRPHVPPPPARAPLGVRRATPEVPRGRQRTATRPARTSSLLGLDGPGEPSRAGAAIEAELDPPSLGARVGADAIDTLLLAVIDASVLVLTLRIAGLSMTLDDMRVLPPIPFVGFLALLAFVYFATFTVAGGQTIGKMIMGIKVIGDDGRSVDAAGGVLRALGCALVPLTLGLSYVPVLITSDRRALHDRLAGTRVVSR